MTKIDIFSGFLGAGKTTLIKKMIEQAYKGEKLVLIENEFGEIGIDGGFLAEAGIQINEMNSGCICCSLVGDFGKALTQVLEQYAPDRILIEPSGVGKLSDVIIAVQDLHVEGAELNAFTTVVDAGKCKMYMKNFGEFFNDQVANAGCIVLSHTGSASEKKVAECVAMLREHNATATIVTTDWDALSAEQLLEAMERKDTLAAELERLEHAHHEHHHHHHDHDEHCECGCHDHEHEHHHHDHDEHCECGCHDHEHEHHHHDHDEHCECGCHDHEHE
ncbi:MAG: cobalamin biosynthesis protein CobW, partial [Clostridia bacterium]|nr:cobalamin biosynthesis protein CobW [Clostridia bacterium]